MTEAEKKGPTATPPMVRFKLDGKDIEAPAGTNLIEAARAQGIHVPYFCYHPGLAPAGNCRMCLVEASNSKKPITACTTPVSEGIEIRTDTPAVKDARKAVLELMLVNHPLDCPICDKSGECMLQDHTFDHGKDSSRMVERKELKPTKPLGSDIHIWGNRCIVCTRCVRFLETVSGTGELCVVERGDRSVVDVFPGYPLQNPLAGNVVDICPVGALISGEFLYQARVWYQKKTPSVCTGCARGCAIEIQALHNEVKRLVPRHNPHVNGYWMCDRGRHDHAYVLAPTRWLGTRMGGSTSALDAERCIAEGLRRVKDSHGPNAVGGIASAFMTVEETWLFREIFRALGADPGRIAALARPDGPEEVFPGFRIAADKNPNREGLRRLLGADVFEGRLEALRRRIEAGEVRALLVVSDRPHLPLGSPGEEELLAALASLEFLAVFQLEQAPPFPPQVAIFPATTFPEKDGSIVNEEGRLQRLRRATELPRGARPETEVFQGILERLGARDRRAGTEGIFREVAGELGLEGASLRIIGPHGIQLPLVPGAPTREGSPT